MTQLITVRSPEGFCEDHTAANANDLITNAGWVAIGRAGEPSFQGDGTPDGLDDAPEDGGDDSGKISNPETELTFTLSTMDKDALIHYAHETFGVKIKATFSVPNIKAQIIGLTAAAKTQIPTETPPVVDGDPDNDDAPEDGGDDKGDEDKDESN